MQRYLSSPDGAVSETDRLSAGLNFSATLADSGAYRPNGNARLSMGLAIMRTEQGQ